jgi:chemotaxis protein methyltransferase CheR
MQIKPRHFKRFSELVYQECGINLHDGKEPLLTARLAKRLRKTGIDSVEEYLQRLESDHKELRSFLDVISTNHTYFFREKQHFEVLHNRHRNIWCAACSSGEEPYSLAITCLEKGFRPHILASDISTDVLRTAQRGIYPAEKAKQIDCNLLKKYFQKGFGRQAGRIRVKPEVRKAVTFNRHNLLSDPPPPQEFEVIFCRNALIYFDRSIKEKVVDKLYKVLRPNGYFIVGGAESLSNISHKFKYFKPSIYRKVH